MNKPTAVARLQTTADEMSRYREEVGSGLEEIKHHIKTIEDAMRKSQKLERTVVDAAMRKVETMARDIANL